MDASISRPDVSPEPVLTGLESCQNVKRYANDPVKEISRQLLKATVTEFIAPLVKPEKIEVLCLPGIDLQEVLSVYDPLGVKRSNITAFEADPAIAARIRAGSPGINLVEGRIENCLDSFRDCRFHVISLDYTGPINVRHLDVVDSLVRGNSAKRFVFHQANSARRDRQSFPLYSGSMNACYGGESSDEVLSRQLKAIAEDTARLRERDPALPDLSSVRSNEFSRLLSLSLECSRYSSDELLRLYQFRGVAAGNNYIERIRSQIQDEFPEHAAIVPGSPECTPGSQMSAFWFSQYDEDLNLMLKKSGCPKDQRTLIRLAELGRVIPRVANEILAHRKYSYVSESGCPMIGDIMLVQFDDAFSRSCFSIADRLRNSLSIDLRRLPQLGNPIALHLSPRPDRQESERQYLGSSFNRRSKVASSSATNGVGGDIQGAARPDNPRDFPLQQSELSKEDAIALLREGVPASEVHEAFPNAFTLNQLRAIRAHITMGTYG